MGGCVWKGSRKLIRIKTNPKTAPSPADDEVQIQEAENHYTYGDFQIRIPTIGDIVFPPQFAIKFGDIKIVGDNIISMFVPYLYSYKE